MESSSTPGEAVEVDEPVELSTLLSLTGKVDDLILRYVALGDGGLQRILNLRKVCSTTKRWVDSVLPGEGRRFFRNCRANVDLRKQSLEVFLRCPPPKGVSVMSLTLGSDFEEIRREKEESWSSFVEIWAPKLEAFELKSFGLSVEPSLRHLCTSSSEVRSFQCLHLDYVDEDFHKFLLQLEEITLRTNRLTNEQRRQLYAVLCTSKNLKRFEVILVYHSDFVGVTDVLLANKENVDFQVTLTFEQNVDQFGDSGECGSGCMCSEVIKDTKRFIKCVAESKSSIRILNKNANQLRTIAILAREEALLKFSATVESISEWHENERTENLEQLRLTDFPNLQRLDSLDLNAESLRVIEFPETLESLGVERGILSPQILPVSMSKLSFQSVECSLRDLMEFLEELASHCSLLESLSFKWTRSVDSKSTAAAADQLPLPTTSFPNLKSLAMEVRFPGVEPSDVIAFRKALLDGLKLPQLSLRSFSFSLTSGGWKDGKVVDVFDTVALSSLIDGRMAETLENFRLDEDATSEDAMSLREKLNGVARHNGERRRETVGGGGHS